MLSPAEIVAIIFGVLVVFFVGSIVGALVGVILYQKYFESRFDKLSYTEWRIQFDDRGRFL